MRRLLIATRTTLLLAGCAGALICGAEPIVRGEPQAAKNPAAASAADLDKLLAPIALYPDTLLAQILLCAGNPGKVAALDEWLASHPNEKGTALQDAATKAGFEPSYIALVLFPDVVATMASRIDWTTQLGKAFAADKSAVFTSIQRLRGKAQQAGKLKDTPQQNVETKSTSGGEVIVIEPANPQVVYVPQYNPDVVYTTSSTVVVQQESSSADAVAAGLIGFTAGIAIGAAIDNDYYYGPYGWGRPVYMYNDAWDDWYDEREDAREDWMDHREDIVEERGDRARDTQEQRTERTEARQENRPEAQAERTERQQNRQQNPQSATSSTSSSTSRPTADSRGTSGSGTQRSGTKSDAFSGYSSGKSERSASQRGQSSRSSSARSSGGRRR